MQESDSHKAQVPLSIQTGGRLLSPNRNLLAHFYSFDDEKTENIQKTESSIKSPGAGDKTKDIQAQLEINQSKLNSLAKRIDDCLSASKTNYATVQVIQPSVSSLSVSSLEENKEAKAPEQAVQDFKPEEPSEEAFLSPNVSNGIMKSVRASMDTTTEEIVMSLGMPRKSVENLKKNNVQQKEKIGQISTGTPKPSISAQKGSPKAPVQKPSRLSTNQKAAGPLQTSDIQKKLETVSSLTIETGEDLPKLKEKYVSPKPEKRVNNYLSPGKTLQKEEGSLSARSRGEKPEGALALNKKMSLQSRPSTHNSKPAVSNPAVETEKPGIKARDTQTERKVNNKVFEKAKSPVRNEPKPSPANKQTPKNIAAVEKKNNLNEEKKTTTSKTKPVKQSLTVKTDLSKKESITVGQEKPAPSSSRKGTIMRFPEECIVGDLEAIRMISPVSPDTKSSKGLYDFSTPGYNFDTPHHNANNLSINDSKNLSFDSALFGKELSVKMDSLQVRRKSGFNNEQNKPKETLKRNNSVKHEKVSTDEDLESSFTRAFTTRKNKIVNEASNFDERMKSDLHYRRRFRQDLQKFLDEQKSKLSEEQTERLIERLVEDSRRRKVQANKIELQNEKGYRESNNTTPAMSEDQLNQTFERLVSDAKKRLLLQEEHEKIKVLKQEEMDRKIERERSKSKMSREAEEKMVSKFVQDADRRRLKYEKSQRAKKEEEIRQANELQAQGFKPKNNNKAKSKVREYINSRTETSLDHHERRDRNQKSFQKDELSRSSSPVEILPTIKEKPLLNEKKFLTPKKQYLSIVSPSNRAEVKESGISKVSPKSNSFSSLEHLQSLRKNINKHKSEIEEHIQNLKEIDTESQIKVNQTSPERTPQQHSKKSEIEQAAMHKKEKTAPTKVSNKYGHVESKVAKHIEGKSIKQNQLALSPDAKDKEMRELPKTALASPKAQNNIKEGLKEERSPVKANKNEDHKGKAQSQTKYMSDKAAIDFVEKLINEFKLAKKV